MDKHPAPFPIPLPQDRTPPEKSFAILNGLEAAVRGTLISALPLTVYETLGSAESTSLVYFMAGVVALFWGLMVPWATRRVPRRWMYTGGCTLYLVAFGMAILGAPWSVALAVMLNAMATATTFVCFNAYVLDYVDRANLGRNQSQVMVYAAAPWAIGPVLGVWLHHLWAPAPFLLAGGFVLALMATFWALRLGNGKQIARARGPAPNPLGYLGRFLSQPRLIAGWMFAVLRSCGWWVYVVYLPIFCIEAGLGDKLGGIALSITNAGLFLSPLILRAVRRRSVRVSVRLGFGACGLLFCTAALLSWAPPLAVVAVMAASFFLIVLDVVGGLPFLMSVKPSQRTEMSAVYSSFRDVSGILTPGAAYVVLLVAPLPGIFAAVGLGLLGAFAVASRLHPRLGAARPSAGGGAAKKIT